MDFENADYYRAAGVIVYWSTATALPCFIMSIGFAFVVLEWCTQSHLSSEDYGKASRGLRRTRWFKKHTAWFRDIPEVLIELVLKVRYNLVCGHAERPGRRSLVWTWQTKQRPPGTIEGSGVRNRHDTEEEADPFLDNLKGGGSNTFRLEPLPTSHTA